MTPKWFIAYIGMSVELREREREREYSQYVRITNVSNEKI